MMFLVLLECFVSKMSIKWIAKCSQCKRNNINTYLLTYVLTFAQPRKNKLKDLFT